MSIGVDLNRNGETQPQPDLPGVGELGKEKDYRDGFLSDLKLQMDPQERHRICSPNFLSGDQSKIRKKI